MPVKSDRALSQILQNDAGEVPKVPEIPYFIRKKQTNPKKNAIIAMLPPGNGICTGPAARIQDYNTVLS